MSETIQERLQRLATAGRKTPEPKPKCVFEMPKDVEPPKGKGYLDRLFDEVDKKHSKTRRAR